MPPALRPCLECGAPTDGPRCAEHRIDTRSAYNSSGYQQARLELVTQGVIAILSGEPLECELCHRPLAAIDDLSADHVEPLAGGGDAGGKLRLVHRRCNSKRGALEKISSDSRPLPYPAAPNFESAFLASSVS
jgi:5-methylcytosine-specific restriction endonuclease McrA